MGNNNIKNIIFFDWDDTLFPSTAFLEKDPCDLNKISENICKILELYSEYGQVYILTNASKNWINDCLTKYMPNLEKYNNIFICARYYSDKYDDPMLWKYYSLVDFFDGINEYINIIAFGDSHVERQAFRMLESKYYNILVKNVKYLDLPTVEEIFKQSKLTIENIKQFMDDDYRFDYMYDYDDDDNLTIMEFA